MSFNFNQRKGVNETPRLNPIKRNIPRWQWYLLCLIILSPLLYFVLKPVADAYFISAPGYVTFDKLLIRSPENGYLADVFAKAGDPVKGQQVLAQFYSPTINKKITALQRELETLKKLQIQLNDKTNDELLTLEKIAQSHVARSLAQYKKVNELKQQGLLTIMELDTAAANLAQARLQLAEIGRKMALHKNQQTMALEMQYGQRIRQLGADIEQFEQLRDLFLLKAPKSAHVIAVHAQAGEYVKQGSLLMALATDDNFHIRAFVKPKDMEYVAQGKRVTILLPDKKKVMGVISNKPSFAERSPESTGMLSQREYSIVLLIRLTQPVADKYKVYGVPVKVLF